jgi:putative NIF3 family GTP cyclohydrolase 1 type 2
VPSTLHEVRQYLDQRLAVHEQADPSGNGLLVAGREIVGRIGAALNTSRFAIESAAAAGVDLLLVHHAPWQEIELHLRDTKLALVRQHGLSLYAAHEALDRSMQDATGGTLADRLGLTIERSGGEDLAIGTAPAMSFEEWLRVVAGALQTRVRAWPNNPNFRRVALVPGGGGTTTYLAQALAAGCDTFVTGEGSLFTELFAQEVGLSLVYASHMATEFPAICDFAQSVAGALHVSYVPIPEAPWITGGGKAPLEFES